MIQIDITSRKYQFSMTVNHKITVIRGDSGKGKSKFTQAAEDVSGAYRIKVSDSRYRLVVPSNKDWYITIQRNIEHKDRCIYIIDDADYVSSAAFSSLYATDVYSYYIIVNRFTRLYTKSLSRLPFSIDEVYTFKANGDKHYLEPFYIGQNVSTQTAADSITVDNILVEDEGAGYQFFSSVNPKTKRALGKEKIANEIKKVTNTVLLLADRAALGNCFDYIIETAFACKVTVLLPRNYISFEFFLLRCNLFKNIYTAPTVSEVSSFASMERLFTNRLTAITSGKPYAYSKGRLSLCYTKPCCSFPENHYKDNCVIKISGPNKTARIFSGTEFEELLTVVKTDRIALKSNKNFEAFGCISLNPQSITSADEQSTNLFTATSNYSDEN